MSMEQKDNEEEERTRLSTLPEFTDDFNVFAQQFSLKSIQDTTGELIPGVADVTPVPISITTDSSGTSATALLRAVPFTISVLQISLDPGQPIAMYASANANQRISYRQVGESAWREMPSSPMSSSDQYAVLPCNDEGTGTTLLILFVSTADVESDTAEITIEQMSTHPDCLCTQSGVSGVQGGGLQDCQKPTGSCTATSITPDPCMISHDWNLDLVKVKELMQQQLATLPDVTINSLDLSGSGVLVIDENNATFTYDDMTVSLDITASGLNLPTTTVIDGRFDANIYTTAGGSGSGDVCLVVYAGEGTAVFTEPLTGGFSVDLGPEGAFVQEDYEITYTCTTDTLILQGYLNGASVWGPYVYTA